MHSSPSSRNKSLFYISAFLVWYSKCWKRLSVVSNLPTFQASGSRGFEVAAFQFIFEISFKPRQVCIQPADVLIHLHQEETTNWTTKKYKKKRAPDENRKGWNSGCYRHEQSVVLQSKAGKGYRLGEGKWHPQRERRRQKQEEPIPLKASRKEGKGRQHKGESKQLRLMIFRTKQDGEILEITGLPLQISKFKYSPWNGSS